MADVKCKMSDCENHLDGDDCSIVEIEVEDWTDKQNNKIAICMYYSPKEVSG